METSESRFEPLEKKKLPWQIMIFLGFHFEENKSRVKQRDRSYSVAWSRESLFSDSLEVWFLETIKVALFWPIKQCEYMVILRIFPYHKYNNALFELVPSGKLS